MYNTTLPSLRSQSTNHKKQLLTFDAITSPMSCQQNLDLDALITYNTHTFAFGTDGLCTLSCMSPRGNMMELLSNSFFNVCF